MAGAGSPLLLLDPLEAASVEAVSEAFSSAPSFSEVVATDDVEEEVVTVVAEVASVAVVDEVPAVVVAGALALLVVTPLVVVTAVVAELVLGTTKLVPRP